ncbi:hypothetical protein K435DRAFT_496017 [Dendrothele bispora CBS 962.96]|uniref:Uncharacterized protein n=1 Tax=Dendrothele bispora (strain CBS 962.96) TaxID=1314807 RepID=A0A4S8MAV4_DENBC|nr:hypothetical protein K435DRAFT_496017 [Dendrothele bispora CBS 962.96]
MSRGRDSFRLHLRFDRTTCYDRSHLSPGSCKLRLIIYIFTPFSIWTAVWGSSLLLSSILTVCA